MSTDEPPIPELELTSTESPIPLWRELTWGAEWLRLRTSPILWGFGVPRGRGEPVVSVPGFLGSDVYLTELRTWLGRIGYTAHVSGIGRNSDCPDILYEKLLETIIAAAGRSDQRVSLVGHSLGGALARAAAITRPDLVSQVITLGSPLRGMSANPLVVALARLVTRLVTDPKEHPRQHGDHVHDTSCSIQVLTALQSPLDASVRLTSIYSRTDGVVDWASSVVDPPDRCIEVNATHIGLVVNPDVYRHIGAALATHQTAVDVDFE